MRHTPESPGERSLRIPALVAALLTVLLTAGSSVAGEIGRFADRVAGWNGSDLHIAWKGERYRPACVVDAQGHATLHLWFAASGKRIESPDRIDELFTALLVLRGEGPSSLRRRSRAHEKQAGSSATGRGGEAPIAGWTSGLAMADKLLVAHLRPVSRLDKERRAQATGMRSPGCLEVAWKLLHLFDSDATTRARNTKELIRGHRATVRSNLATAARDVGKLLAARVGLVEGTRLQAEYDKIATKLDTTELLQFFRPRVDTRRAAKRAVERALLDRTARLLNLELGDLYRRAAAGTIRVADELLLLALMEVQLAQVRLDLLARRCYDRSEQADLRLAGNPAVAQAVRRVAALEDRANRIAVALELQVQATLSAVSTDREPSTWSLEPVRLTEQERGQHDRTMRALTEDRIGVVDAQRYWRPTFESQGSATPVDVPREIHFLEPSPAVVPWSRVQAEWRHLRKRERAAVGAASSALERPGAGAYDDAHRQRCKWEKDLQGTYFASFELGTLRPASGQRLRGLLMQAGPVAYFFTLGED